MDGKHYENPYSRKSKRYRRKHLEAVAQLIGGTDTPQDMPEKALNSIKVKRSRSDRHARMGKE
jgi:hypothetical protein